MTPCQVVIDGIRSSASVWLMFWGTVAGVLLVSGFVAVYFYRSGKSGLDDTVAVLALIALPLVGSGGIAAHQLTKIISPEYAASSEYTSCGKN